MGSVITPMGNQLGDGDTECPQTWCTAAATGCKVANLWQHKSNNKAENVATGGVWLFLHMEDFQDLSSVSRRNGF